MSEQRIVLKCPCCNNLITIILDNGGISNVFFHVQNQHEIIDKLSELGYEFGINGGI